MKIVCVFCSWLISLVALAQSTPEVAGKKDSSAVIVIRCHAMATLNADNKPLILLDGVPVEMNLSDVNADDIEKITILKAPEATALYGSRGAAGVIAITTRKLKSGDEKESFFAIYPNPVQKGQLVTIELKNKPVNRVQVKIFSLDGRLLLTRNQEAFKDHNSFAVQTDNCWVPGTYFIRILDTDGESLQTGKLVIQ